MVVVGTSGNAGTSLLEALAREDAVESILGLCRRRPEARIPKTTWAEADIERDALESHFRAADAVVHLAWRIQPSRDLASLRRTNVDGIAVNRWMIRRARGMPSSTSTTRARRAPFRTRSGGSKPSSLRGENPGCGTQDRPRAREGREAPSLSVSRPSLWA